MNLAPACWVKRRGERKRGGKRGGGGERDRKKRRRRQRESVKEMEAKWEGVGLKGGVRKDWKNACAVDFFSLPPTLNQVQCGEGVKIC